MYVCRKIGRCPTCGDPTEFRGINKGYGAYCCFDCNAAPEAQDSKLKTRTKTNIERTGYANTWDNPEVQRKSKATNLKQFGTEYAAASEIVRNKIQATTLERYGTIHVMQNAEVLEKVRETNLARRGVEWTWLDPKVRSKTKATNLERYGVEYAGQSKEVRMRVHATNLERYGAENPFASPEIIERIKATNLERYGFEWSSQNPATRVKARATNLERYGAPHPMQNADVFQRMQENSYLLKYETINGKIFAYQGYEIFVVRRLAKKYDVNHIITDPELMPPIFFTFEGRRCRYYPDIMIGKQIYEVKCGYTFGSDPKIKAKAYATLRYGYKYKCVVVDKIGKIEKILTANQL